MMFLPNEFSFFNCLSVSYDYQLTSYTCQHLMLSVIIQLICQQCSPKYSIVRINGDKIRKTGIMNEL